MLQELIQKLQKDHGLTSEQSTGILSTVTGFIKEKFPMMKDAVDKMFAAQPAQPQVWRVAGTWPPSLTVMTS